jgi:hypothetical protein
VQSWPAAPLGAAEPPEGVAGPEVVAAPKGEETLVAGEGEVDCCYHRTSAVGAGNTSGAAAAADVVAAAAAAVGRGRSCTEAGAAGAARAEAAAAAHETVVEASARTLAAAAAAGRTGSSVEAAGSPPEAAGTAGRPSRARVTSNPNPTTHRTPLSRLPLPPPPPPPKKLLGPRRQLRGSTRSTRRAHRCESNSEQRREESVGRIGVLAQMREREPKVILP